MARITLAAQVAALTDAVAALTAQAATPARTTSARTAEASAHFKAKDLPCLLTPACTTTFKTAKGQAWHSANRADAHKA